MRIEPLPIEGAWLITPEQRCDPRGMFLELYRFDCLAKAAGHPMRLAQANLAVSARDVVRGIHFADVPPGQAKYVTCVSGQALDVVVDVRLGSPTYGQWHAVRLDETDRCAVYLSEGLGHGYRAVTERATLVYLCSTTYKPEAEHGVHPLDEDLAIQWGVPDPVLSDRDKGAPTLAELARAGSLPSLDSCLQYRAGLAGAHAQADAQAGPGAA